MKNSAPADEGNKGFYDKGKGGSSQNQRAKNRFAGLKDGGKKAISEEDEDSDEQEAKPTKEVNDKDKDTTAA